jgi:hypothetical protein
MSDEVQKNILTEIRARHEQDQRWRNGPSMICPHAHDDRGWLLAEIERLRNLDANRTRSRVKLADRDRRERIATACLAGFVANPEYSGKSEAYADAAVQHADALIARLDREAKP